MSDQQHSDKGQRAEAIDRYEVSLRQANKHAAHDAMLKLLCEWARETVAPSAVAASIAMDAHHLHQLIGMLPEYEGVEIVKVTAKTIAKIKAASATLTRAAIEQSVASSATLALTDVCDALFGCFLSPTFDDLHQRAWECALCEKRVDLHGWVHAEHEDGCIIPKVRAHLAQHRPASVPPNAPVGPSATEKP